jgi:oxaloacetate decarboxylase gamma subunit
MNEMGIALELLGVGMVTVFIILALVVILGDLIIRFVNRFMPEVEKVVVAKNAAPVSEINPKKISVIVSTVSKITNGTGRVIKIEKL